MFVIIDHHGTIGDMYPHDYPWEYIIMKLDYYNNDRFMNCKIVWID